ncbi:hypothetical protein STCU_10931 [Strigomonas culicis]|uniref:Uncharacterized protein n=1 Tax=Strigomonas culicis TaxID=28005 RepID=S9UQG0_9TRYP|nr:hypothetical protein STCU_10931 [Strigomonas culicis]|eukprot:EPY16886.1 hypothetical protein STCU_10931 [Strigomonas culicis]
MRWSLEHSNGARGYAAADASDEDGEALDAVRARAAGCYYCRCLRRRERRHARGCTRSADLRLLCAPSQYVIASPHLVLPPRAAAAAAPASGSEPQLWHTVCLPAFKVTGARRFRLLAHRGGGRRYRAPGRRRRTTTAQAGSGWRSRNTWSSRSVCCPHVIRAPPRTKTRAAAVDGSHTAAQASASWASWSSGSCPSTSHVTTSSSSSSWAAARRRSRRWMWTRRSRRGSTQT